MQLTKQVRYALYDHTTSMDKVPDLIVQSPDDVARCICTVWKSIPDTQSLCPSPDIIGFRDI